MRRLRRFFELSSVERRLLLKAALVLVAARLGLWLLPLRRLRGLLARAAHPSADAHVAAPSALERVVWAIEAAARSIPKSTCLVKALAAQVLLGRAGYPARLHVGVANQDKGFEAHAWLECEGKIVIGEPEPGHYSPLLTLETGKP